MKKTLALILALLMAATVMASCGGEKTEGGTEALDALGLEGIVNKIYETKAPQFMTGVIPVDISDADAVNMYLGLENGDKIEEAVASESMIGSQAYSLVIAKVKEGENAAEVAEEMEAGINPRKWICVAADDIAVTTKGNYICFCMISSDFAADFTANDAITAFNAIK